MPWKLRVPDLPEAGVTNGYKLPGMGGNRTQELYKDSGYSQPMSMH